MLNTYFNKCLKSVSEMWVVVIDQYIVMANISFDLSANVQTRKSAHSLSSLVYCLVQKFCLIIERQTL